MSVHADMAERQGRVLIELTELGMAVVRKLAARIEAAETVEDAERLALAFHRASRSVRLTLALETRLDKERREGFRDQRVDDRKAIETRKQQVTRALSRELHAERESDEAERLLGDLGDRLDDEALFEAFLAGPVEACIARIRKDLSLPANDRGTIWSGLINPPPQGEGDREAVEGVEAHYRSATGPP